MAVVCQNIAYKFLCVHPISFLNHTVKLWQ
nr:MAG TPA: hypothetical protein [Caudoviricetes sp.]DAO46505.1 MAG TPA: hypothetical protein [Caudoviricetes sp.]DAQ91247.1 MAG TPA: hypothetical protein [Caudoviricetes sp.]DAU94980.1 MAG TPA: hypothetical protein [Caudoviricetes sp.]DAV48017.1 MAG TPA: hypothetical protein [Caudoviricetes sp.]